MAHLMLIYLNKFPTASIGMAFSGEFPSMLPYEIPGTAFIPATSIAAE